jgi:putative transposase
MKTINYTYKLRLYPTENQKILLAKHFGATRFVWNRFLAERQKSYQKEGKSVNYYDDARKLVSLKKSDEFFWLKEINSQSLQATAKFLDGAYNDFFKKLGGFPRYKSKKDNKHSFRVPQNVIIKNSKLTIPKFKEGIRIKLHREIVGKVCFATVTKNAAEQYHVSITVEKEIETKKSKIRKAIGIDLGVKDSITTSENQVFTNPKFTKKHQKKITKLSRQLAKKEKDSKNRNRARIKLAKAYLKITNRRNDYIHKMTSKLVNENQIILAEDLHVKGMVRNRKLAKSISDACFGEITRQLKYKSEWAGQIYYEVDRFYPSSKTCSECGYINKGLKLAERVLICNSCETKLNRDENAAKNILWYGLKKLTEENIAGTAKINACGLPSYGRPLIQSLRSNGRKKQEASTMRQHS